MSLSDAYGAALIGGAAFLWWRSRAQAASPQPVYMPVSYTPPSADLPDPSASSGATQGAAIAQGFLGLFNSLTGNSIGGQGTDPAQAPGGGQSVGSILSNLFGIATGSASGMNTTAIGAQLMADLQSTFGLTKEQAAGIVGNLHWESAGFSAFYQNGITPGAGGVGYAQWDGSRRKAFLNYAQATGQDPQSYGANFGYLVQELQGPEAYALQAVRATSSAADAAVAFEQTFERAGVPALQQRAALANAYAAA